jgi:hypothetical protein
MIAKHIEVGTVVGLNFMAPAGNVTRFKMNLPRLDPQLTHQAENVMVPCLFSSLVAVLNISGS